MGEWEDCQRTLQEVMDQHGRLDILVNNAGITVDRTIWKMTVDDWHKVLRVNLSGTFYLSKPALEHMLERGSGRIINISSIIGQTGNIGQANYAASKSGLFGLTMTMAKEAAFALGKADKLTDEGPGLTVNAVAPGFVSTEMVEAVPEKVLDKLKPQIPLRPPRPPGGDRPRGASSWPRTSRATSPGRCGPSTAAWTCRVAPAGEGRRSAEVEGRDGNA